MGDKLRPVNLPDMSAPVAPAPIGRELDAAKERVAQARYEKGGELDLGSGAFVAPAPEAVATATPGEVAWHAGDKVLHRRFGEGIVVSSRLEKGDEWVTVAFPGQGVKELIAAYAGPRAESEAVSVRGSPSLAIPPLVVQRRVLHGHRVFACPAHHQEWCQRTQAGPRRRAGCP